MKIKKFAFILFASLIVVSCFKDAEETPLEVNTDVYMIKRLVGEQPVYGLAFYAYGNQIMRSGTVIQNGGLGEQINLGLSPNSIFTLSKEPSGDDYKTFVPAASEYIFKVTAETGLSDESSDFLNVKNIGIPEITSVEIGANQKLVNITWKAVAGIDGYVVKVAEENGTYIYNSGGMESSETTYTINLLTGNWTKPIEMGNTYIIEVHAFAYEDDADPDYAAFNVEEISIGARNIFLE